VGVAGRAMAADYLGRPAEVCQVVQAMCRPEVRHVHRDRHGRRDRHRGEERRVHHRVPAGHGPECRPTMVRSAPCSPMERAPGQVP
jgi:hypothetical protein